MDATSAAVRRPRGAAAPAAQGLLRVLTCGSVDDGKSTLLGRILLETGDIPSDLMADLGGNGIGGDGIDLALLFDGLEAEREQGITIDVTHRALTTPNRRFRLLDAPGHEQYTRNMATAATGADVAILLVDVEKGILPQTRRHASICDLFGIRHIVLAVNKMDRAGFEEARFREVVARFSEAIAGLGFATVHAVPVSALHGDNIDVLSPRMPWWSGPPVIGYLEALEVADEAASRPLRLPVQLVLREGERRLYAGTLSSGSLETGATVLVAPSGRQVRIAELRGASGIVDRAVAGEAVSVVTDGEVDLARGDVLAPPTAPPLAAGQLSAHVLWLAEENLFPGRSYLLRIGTAMVPGSVTAIRHKLDVMSSKLLAAASLEQNEIGLCHLSMTRPVAFDPFRDDPGTGAFILIDRSDFRTVGAGVILHDLRRSQNVRPQALAIGKAERAGLKGQTPAILWFTGLSGSGKSTLANLVEQRLWSLGHHTVLLDGDNLRHGLNQDLGFSEADRVENIRRVGQVAKLMLEAGLIVICSFISPYRAERDMARDLVGAGEFLELFVEASVEECTRRDPKGLYAKALSGEIPNFPGVSSPYEPPLDPELRLDTANRSPEELLESIVGHLRDRGLLGGPGPA